MYDLEPKNLIQCTGRVLYKRYNADEGTLFQNSFQETLNPSPMITLLTGMFQPL